MALTATRTENPWRFEPGDHVYIAGRPQEPAIVTAALGLGRTGWPHYFVVDFDGYELRVPQIHLSSSPIEACHKANPAPSAAILRRSASSPAA